METTIKLPSRFQIGDMVSISIGNDLVIRRAEILKVHFTEGKVFYDLVCFFKIPNDEKVYSTRVYNVDAALLNLSNN